VQHLAGALRRFEIFTKTDVGGQSPHPLRFPLLATGIVDESPDLPGIKEAIANGSIRYCRVARRFRSAPASVTDPDRGSACRCRVK
jgi:hypothetical protein